MIKFFRKIRQKLLSENRFNKYLIYAIGEIFLVVVGILIALQINNWNENRKERIKEREILKSLQFDLEADKNEIQLQLSIKGNQIKGFYNSLKILTNQKKGSNEEFREGFKYILTVGGFSVNQTTFNNLQTTGEIRLIRNKALADSIVKYYTSDYFGWETAFQDYARNTIAPYVMEFDHLDHGSLPNFTPEFKSIINVIDDKVLPTRPLSDYKKNYFIINALRQRLFNLEGLIMEYKTFLKRGERLNIEIEKYLKTND